MKKYTRKLQKDGTHSFTINIPKEVVKSFNWRERQKLTISIKPRKRIEIRDWRARS
ncbi:MAG: hypothetical protein ABIJ28_01810 [Patescibacteria group bacterium]